MRDTKQVRSEEQSLENWTPTASGGERNFAQSLAEYIYISGRKQGIVGRRLPKKILPARGKQRWRQ